jgi:response regulator RpfG family c-di-GMP phosphodiesterase
MAEKILFVDDEPNILAGFKRQLRGSFNVETAIGGEQGLQMLATEPFAVVVTDFRMPGMDGVQFLTHALEVSPDTVRMMLTGHAELSQAIDAINEGNIFRFLTKPCAPEALNKALNAALEQYRLLHLERDLMEKTLSNVIRLLTDVLAMANPLAFSQTLRIRKIVRQITTSLKTYDSWMYQLAAMLSQLGCIALPDELLRKAHSLQPLTRSEESMYASHPLIAYKLLQSIPRIDMIAEIVRDQAKPYEDFQGASASPEQRKVELGAQILKVAVDYDCMTQAGMIHEAIQQHMRLHNRRYNPQVVQALGEREILSKEWQVCMMTTAQVEPGMIADEDICAKTGEVLLPHNQEFSMLSLERLKLFSDTVGVVEPFRVLVAMQPHF